MAEANSIVRVKLVCLLGFSSVRPGMRRASRKAHYGRPAKVTGRLARRAQQDPAASRPVRGGIEQRVRVNHCGARRRPRNPRACWLRWPRCSRLRPHFEPKGDAATRAVAWGSRGGRCRECAGREVKSFRKGWGIRTGLAPPAFQVSPGNILVESKPLLT